MARVYSLIIWLKDSGLIPLEQSQVAVDPGAIGEGHRSFVFNSPALPRVHYAHFDVRGDAEAALRRLCGEIDAGRTTIVRVGDTTFAIPAHSVHYVALGEGEAAQVRPSATNVA